MLKCAVWGRRCRAEQLRGAAPGYCVVCYALRLRVPVPPPSGRLLTPSEQMVALSDKSMPLSVEGVNRVRCRTFGTCTED